MLNFPKTYIKKCQASKELQLLWKRNEGDYYLDSLQSKEIRRVVNEAVSEKAFWLPTLEQLIELVREIPRYKNESDLNLLSKMRVCISNACCSSFLKHQSMYDFWLIMWYQEKFKFDWYEGRNEWK